MALPLQTVNEVGLRGEVPASPASARPIVLNHRGDELPHDAAFFKRPSGIGQILTAYTSLREGMAPSSSGARVASAAGGAVLGALVGLAIVAMASVTSTVWVLVWLIAPALLGLLIGRQRAKFVHNASFVGTEGFASYRCEGTPDNIISCVEVRFDEVTDCAYQQVVRKQNFSYMGTDFVVVWLDVESGRVVHAEQGSYHDKEGQPPLDQAPDYWLYRSAMARWTAYQKEQLDRKLAEVGALEFNLYSFEKNTYGPYIRLGVGYLEVGGVRYDFGEIKRAYRKGTDLHIEHASYEKKLLRRASGEKSVIPLLNLCNRSFFFEALERLMGVRL